MSSDYISVEEYNRVCEELAEAREELASLRVVRDRLRYWMKRALEAERHVFRLSPPPAEQHTPQMLGRLAKGYQCLGCGLVVEMDECPTWLCSCGKQTTVVGWIPVLYNAYVTVAGHT